MKILKTFFILFISLFIVWGIALKTPWIKEQATEYLKEEFTKATGWTIELEGINIYPSFDISASNVVLSDPDNRITAQKIHINVSPYDFYKGIIGFNSLHLEGIQANLDSNLFADGGEIPLISDLMQEIIIRDFHFRNLQVKIDQKEISKLPLDLHGHIQVIPESKSLIALLKGNPTGEINQQTALEITLKEKKNSYDGEFALNHPYSAIDGKIEISSDGSVSLDDLIGAVGPANIEGHLSLNSSYLIKNSGLKFTIPELEKVGNFTGETILTGYIYSPEISLKIHSPKINWMKKSFEDVLIDISANYKNQKLTGQAVLALTKDKSRMEYRSDFRWRQRDSKQSAQLSFSGDIHSILDLFDFDTPLIGGNVSINLSLKPTPEGQKIETFIDLSEGYYEILDLGTVIQDIQARLEVTPHSIIIQNLSGNDGKTGTVTGSGSCQINTSRKFPFEINFDVNDFTIVQLDYSRAIGSGNLTFSGDTTSALISGELRTDSARLTIPERIQELPETIEITYINIPEGESAPTIPLSPTSRWPISYNLHLIVPDKAQIRAEGLFSEWRGEVQMTGKAGELLFNGEFSLDEGSYRFQGKDFKITQGTISMDGDVRKKTQLYVIGEIEIDDKDIEVILKGPVRNPGITFRSNPPLTQREILSWLIFGQGASNLTPFQGSQLNDSITNLKTGKTGADPLTKFRDAVGIDRIDIRKTESSDADDVTLRVGKYISRGTYLSLTKRNVTDDSKPFIQGTSVGIETTVMKNLRLQAEVGDDANGQLNLLWKKDY